SYHQVMYLTSDWISSPNTFEIKALLADPVHPGTIVHQRTPNAYYSIGFLSGQNGLSLNSIFDWNVNIIGTTTTSAGAVNAVGTHTFNKSDTNIIKVYHKDNINFPNTFDVITNGKIQNVISAVSPALINNTTFFEMTADGYKLLTLNQLTPKNGQSIFKNASHAYLDAHVKEFIDIDRYPGLTVAWSEYPDTSTEGAKSGKLLVTQKSSTGKDLTYEYPVNVNVVPGSVQLFVSDTADFGTIENDGRGKIAIADFGALVLDSTYIGDRAIHEKNYHITASIKDKNEDLASYLYLLDAHDVTDDLEKRPDFTDEVRASEEKSAEFLTKNASMYNLINSVQRKVKSSLYGYEEPSLINLADGHDVPYHPEDLDYIIGNFHEKYLGLFLAIPPNTPLKVGQNRATITWDIAEVP
ncbi:TPA: hypothetical protein ACGBG5_003540, partial [Enterococcus faecalis]